MKNISQNQTKTVAEIIDNVRQTYNIRGKFTKADFFRICKAENIRLMMDEFLYRKIRSTKGMFVRNGNRCGIYLRSFHHTRFDLNTAFHELGHYFCGHTSIRLKTNPSDSVDRFEQEADLFAELACRGKKSAGNPLARSLTWSVATCVGRQSQNWEGWVSCRKTI